MSKVGECQICGELDNLRVFPLGTTSEGLMGCDPIDAKLCQSCHHKLKSHYREI